MENNTMITKETKNKIRVDYEGKLTFKERLLSKVKTWNTWLKVIVNIFRFILMLGVSYVILFPFISRIAGSFMPLADVLDPTVSLIPKDFTLDIYKYLIVEKHYFDALWHTALLSLLCALIQTLIACVIGYGLAKFKFKGNTAIMLAVVISMVIPHRTLSLAMTRHFTEFDLFAVQSVKSIEGLEWMKGPIELILGEAPEIANTFWPLIILSITGLAFKNGLYIYMMRQFFKGVPDELEESAYVDGSGVFRTFFMIILPLSVPMMITIFLFSFSWQWTDEFYTRIFWTDPNSEFYLMPDIYQQPDMIGNVTGAAIYNNVIQNTAGILIILPLVIMYLFCQRYLVQGIERSGLVG